MTERWEKEPDALTAKQAAELINFKPQRINELVKKEKLHGVKIGSVQYVSKDEFIEYVSSPEMVVRMGNAKYKELINNY